MKGGVKYDEVGGGLYWYFYLNHQVLTGLGNVKKNLVEFEEN